MRRLRSVTGNRHVSHTICRNGLKIAANKKAKSPPERAFIHCTAPTPKTRAIRKVPVAGWFDDPGYLRGVISIWNNRTAVREVSIAEHRRPMNYGEMSAAYACSLRAAESIRLNWANRSAPPLSGVINP